ncbi:serine hydrolase domain-containing protein [Cesiribacter andamanensis]|uniref:serine hydrolase domain-containing protein n=1 Tax=Cesiribacter andamanensis TaxID=649507 RepID=UPI00373FDE58
MADKASPFRIAAIVRDLPYRNWTLYIGLLLCLTVQPEASAQRKRPATPYYPEAGNWEKRTPESQGLNAARLQEAIRFAQENEAKAPRNLREAHYQGFGKEPFGDAIGPFKDRGEPTGLIIKGGYIVAEWGNPEEVNLTYSVSKSFLSTVVGLAWQQGLIRRLEDRVHPYMAPIIPYTLAPAVNKADLLDQPEVLEPFASPHNQKITWDHLLRQTSDWEGTLWGKPDWADRPQGEATSWRTRPRNEPGSVYKYNDVRVNVLALAATNLWRRPLPLVLKEKVMDPIGASGSWRWLGYENSWIVLDGQPVQVVSGGAHWGGGMFISALDQARFGYLTLRRGRWKEQQLLSEAWMAHALTPTSANTGYGVMNYFLNTDKKQFPSAPESAFAHLGAGTNMVYVDRENDLIIVARWIENSALDGLIARVLQSLQP